MPGRYAEDGINVFSYCNGLKEIIVDERHSEYKSVDGVVYSKDETELLIMPLGYYAREYVVPDGVTKIAAWCFRHCENIESIVLAESLQRINAEVFLDFTSLREVTMSKNVEIIDAEAFKRCENVQYIHASGYDVEILNAIKTGTAWVRPVEEPPTTEPPTTEPPTTEPPTT